MSLTWSLKDTGAHIASPSYCFDFARFLGRIYASCHYGIPYTTDDGATWTMTNLRPVGTNYYCRRIIVHNGRLFVSGTYHANPITSVCYYTDDGLTWTTKKVSNSYKSPSGRDFYSLGGTLFMGHTGNISYGTYGSYYYTNDYGVTWNRVRHPMRNCNTLIERNSKMYIGGRINNSISTKYEKVYSTTTPTIYDTSWLDESTGLSTVNLSEITCLKEFNNSLYCCDNQGDVYKKTGSTWNIVFSGSALVSCRHMDVFYGKLYVCGNSATLAESSVYSTKDGTTWTAEGITSYHTDVYGIWGDTDTRDIWAGTGNSRAWITYVPPPRLPVSGFSTVSKNEKLGIEGKGTTGSEITSITNLEVESKKNGQSISGT